MEKKAIPGFGGMYYTDGCGLVVTADGTIVPSTSTRLGSYVTLQYGDRSTPWSVRDLVYTAFVGPIPPGCAVCPKDRDWTSVDHSNMELVPTSKFREVSKETPRKPNTRSRGAAKRLTEEQVRHIRENPDGLFYDELGALHGVTKQTVWMIRSGRGWKHLKNNSANQTRP